MHIGWSGWLLGLVVMITGPATAGDVTLEPCPETPNCVSSLATDAGHRVEPLHFTVPAEQAWVRLQAVLAGMPRTRIVEQSPQRLRVEFTSRVFRFVDDLTCVMDGPAGLIHIRSASRVGYSDFGVNRRRVEAVRARFEESSPAGG